MIYLTKIVCWVTVNEKLSCPIWPSSPKKLKIDYWLKDENNFYKRDGLKHLLLFLALFIKSLLVLSNLYWTIYQRILEITHNFHRFSSEFIQHTLKSFSCSLGRQVDFFLCSMWITERVMKMEVCPASSAASDGADNTMHHMQDCIQSQHPKQLNWNDLSHGKILNTSHMPTNSYMAYWWLFTL